MPSNYRPLTGKSKARSASAVEVAGRVLTIFSAGFVAVAVLCSFGTPSSSSLRPQGWKLPSIRAGSSGARCDPFAQPGYVESPHSAGELASWRTFDSSCPPSDLFARLVSTLGHRTSADPSQIAPHLSSDLKSSPDSERIAAIAGNRTVLLIGDHHVDRTLVEHFCTLVGRKAVKIDRAHPWGDALDAAAKSNGQATAVDADVALAHFCHVPEYDLLLTSVYSFGADHAETWKSQRLYNAPTRFESRITDLYQPLLAAMASSTYTSPALPKPRLRREPDLVIFNSGLWDLARWASDDIDSGASLIDNLSEQRILWWRGRMVDILTALRKTWKRSRIVWRNTHFPLASEANTVEWFLGTEGAVKKNHPLYHSNRISQLNNAQRSLLEPQGDDVAKGYLDRSARMPVDVHGVDFANLILGQDQHQLDPLTPSLSPAGSIFAELVLWNLQAAVEGR
ncbi:uncharacterized protein PFL1_04373 [Pseudozyma flocculosa PF-1]|uniref:Uncharacterized protein n=2 Tax=Pseudozyma flocculosa TaxID=84751 RepID=A0A5C3FFT7_9BASI|nr:uncharacterized protein PFL1_04373 [Pseudozyma flocculosa PF-1]EPQ28046.1 hypothetical protein PFL1_04373 [Pseudozyma flocculosa PF-1]SPO42219.1 uncharacterized protein PSFLO_07702 [Pseudozyma flocculosa]